VTALGAMILTAMALLIFVLKKIARMFLEPTLIIVNPPHCLGTGTAQALGMVHHGAM